MSHPSPNPQTSAGQPANDGRAAAPPAVEGFDAFYAATSSAAYSLAARITGEAEAASAACEEAYRAIWRDREGLVPSAESEMDLLGRVRGAALRISHERATQPIRSATETAAYMEADAVRVGMNALDPFARRTLELAYFGGLGVAQIVELVGKPAPDVRAALRTALLTLGALSRAGQESTR